MDLNTKRKITNIGLILSSFLGYFEWGANMGAFIFETEWDIITKLFTEPGSVLHPFILFPLAGQVLLVITIFQKQPSKKLSFIGMLLIGILLWFLLAIGLMSMKYAIILSTLPFTFIAIFSIWYFRFKKSHS